ncbi:DUF5819 family protein [Streptomyces sp. NPDC056061]|uniref:DUF5819 family protein n=1 Tax=Streptomyces sp. NPDC056061 TaxID=3345700 RepID=UPI0035DA362A
MDSYDDAGGEHGNGNAVPRDGQREGQQERAAGRDEDVLPVLPSVSVPPSDSALTSVSAGGPAPALPSVTVSAVSPDPVPASSPAGGFAPVPPSDSVASRDRAPAPVPAAGSRAGMAALSPPYQIAAAIALSVIGLVACGHLAMIFLYVSPSNTLTKQHGEAVNEWIDPEFERNWKLFAPNPLQQNVAIHVRSVVVSADGERTTPWMSLSAEDSKAIRGNFLPSHVQQNELRRGWDFYLSHHDRENRANGLRGELSERYMRRLAMLRLSEHDYGGTIERIQLRSEVRTVAAPPWSNEQVSTEPSYWELPWWTVTEADLPEGAEGVGK